MPVSAHYWTIGPRIIHSVKPFRAPEAKLWRGTVEDPDMGAIHLTGLLSERPGTDSILIVLHGLGGWCHSYYSIRAASAAWSAGISCLRLNLRGADRSGEDFYHAGLTADLGAALSSPQISRYPRKYVLGYSLGGHIALRYAAENPGDGIRAAAAVSSPLNLELCQQTIDEPRHWLYRQYLLVSLKAFYKQVAARRSLPAPVADVLSVNTIRDFDEVAVAGRFHFAGARDYYERASVWPTLGRLRTPSLLVASENDPMVSADGVRPWLREASRALDVRWRNRGGHVGFPPGLDLGENAPRGLEPQVINWLLNR
jgi:hypothetical protein